MVFSSTIFLFFFLPLVLLIYYGALRNRSQRNVFLTIMSLLFYAWGEPWFVLVLIVSIGVNWYGGMKIGESRGTGAAKRWLAMTLVFNLLLLCLFKYLIFFMDNINWMFRLQIPVPKIILPLGISFFTFQAISYVMDVYRGDGLAQKSFLNVCLYISFFPQLLMGPIVRYQTVADEIQGRIENVDDFTEGARRFLIGLAKKIIIANNLALMVDHAYSMPDNGLSVAVAWLGATFYHVQVFFDFAGYSDMAIGLGRMFGFHFLENFNYPMISKSITEFWRRWHISLGSWFRDYVFFPLGGSRVKSKLRLAFNMLIVWSLTGLWHGAKWCFLFWGLGFFVLLVLERFTGLKKFMEKSWLGYVYSNVAVVIITVMLRSTDLTSAFRRVGCMFGIGATSLWDSTASMYIREYGVFMALAIIFSIPVGDWLERKLHIPKPASQIARAIGITGTFIVTLSYVIMGSYNPFVYFNF